MPVAVAVNVVIVEVPPMFKIPVVPLPLVSAPAPIRAVEIVSVPLLVYVPVTATEGMVRVPAMV